MQIPSLRGLCWQVKMSYTFRPLEMVYAFDFLGELALGRLDGFAIEWSTRSLILRPLYCEVWTLSGEILCQETSPTLERFKTSVINGFTDRLCGLPVERGLTDSLHSRQCREERLCDEPKAVFERRTATGSKAFSPLTGLDATTFVLLSVFTPIETISSKIWAKPLPKNTKGRSHYWIQGQFGPADANKSEAFEERSAKLITKGTFVIQWWGNEWHCILQLAAVYFGNC